MAHTSAYIFKIIFELFYTKVTGNIWSVQCDLVHKGHQGYSCPPANSTMTSHQQ